MANLLNLLGLGATAAVGAKNAAAEGQRQGLLDTIAQRDADLQARMREAQIADLEAQTQARTMGRPADGETYGVTAQEVIGPDGKPMLVRFGNRGGRIVEQGLGRPEAQPSQRNIDPLSPEGIKQAAERARELAGVAAETGDRSLRTPTEAQEKSYLYGQMMRQAGPLIDELSPRADGRKISLALGRVVQTGEDFLGPGALTGDLLGPEEQQLINAARVWAAGVLRKESGAAITPSELRDTFQRFIPLGSDSPEVKAQKAANRKMAEQLMGDLSLPAEQYYTRIRSINGGAPQAAPAQPNAPVQQPPSDWMAAYEQFRRGRNP